MKPNKGQDDLREILQKSRFGFDETHPRDRKYDVFYKLPIDFKTRNTSRGCVSTKRKFTLESAVQWQNTILVVSDYESPDALLDADYIIFPEALDEWRAEQVRKLNFSTRGAYYSLSEVDHIENQLRTTGTLTSRVEGILIKLRSQAHLNDPTIGKTLFSSLGRKIIINRKMVKVKNHQFFIKVPSIVDKAQFLRNKIDDYTRKKNG
tara:strand:+ start:176 stop:796 length:621 start_codon:yes stop_codon:yes gene_type:complete